MVIARTLIVVDEATDDGCEVFGLVVDLVKCFNRIPRIPLLRALMLMGIPVAYLRALEGMLDDVARYAELSHQIGQPIRSTCGFPEGCAFSVAVMLMLSVWASSYLTFHHPEVEPNFFADNWGIICNTSNTLRAATRRLEMFTYCLQMAISPEKSWVWSNTSKGRQKIQHTAIYGRPVAVYHRATDLGCDVSYGKAKVKTKSRLRLQKTKRALDRTHRKMLPKQFKKVMTNTIVTGVIAHGAALVNRTEAEWRTIRTSMVQCLGRYRSGANPWLSTSVCGKLTDPQLADILRKFRFWRKYFCFHPWDRAGFLRRLTLDGQRCVGPAAILQAALVCVGWKCLSGGVIRHSSGLKVNWINDSFKHVRHIMHAAWTHQVSVQLAHRKGFDIAAFDQAIFDKSFSQFDERDRGSLLALAVGKNVTRNALCHYSRNVKDDKCALCGEVDSKQHRVFHCGALQELRKEYHVLFRTLGQMPEAFWNFGIAETSWEGWQVKCQLPDQWPALSVPPQASPCTVFSDGSAFLQDTPQFTISSGAAIAVDGDCCSVLEASLVPGADHSSYRGEAWAILLALESVWAPQFFTDCSAVVDLLQSFLMARCLGTHIVPCKHWDIWQCIRVHILQRPPNLIHITKVDSHVDWQTSSSAFVRWAGRWNDVVDRVAKQVILHDHKSVLNKLTKLAGDVEHQAQRLHDFHRFWVTATTKAMAKSDNQHNSTTQTTPTFDNFFLTKAVYLSVS